MTHLKVRVGIAGVGNSASTFIQGLRHYGSRKTIEGLWHPRVGGLTVGDIEVVAAFDIDSRKVGLDLSEAIFAKPNVGKKYLEVPKMGVEVQPGLSKGDLPPHLSSEKLSLSTTEHVSKELATSGVTILLNLISSGTPRSSLDYANAAAEAGCSFVNCTPNILVSRPALAKKFFKAKLCLAGDDLMSQFGGTIFHKGLLSLMVKRGIRISKSYQLDVGGGSETFNTIDEEIKVAKRKLKTSSVAQEVPYQFETVAGTTDYVDYMGNERTSYFWFDGSTFLNSRVGVDVYLRSSDGANAGNVLLDVIRALSTARESRVYGAVGEVCAYGFKSPPRRVNFEEAYASFKSRFLR